VDQTARVAALAAAVVRIERRDARISGCIVGDVATHSIRSLAVPADAVTDHPVGGAAFRCFPIARRPICHTTVAQGVGRPVGGAGIAFATAAPLLADSSGTADVTALSAVSRIVGGVDACEATLGIAFGA